MSQDLLFGVWNESSMMPPSADRLVMTAPQVKRASAAIGRIRGRRGPNMTVWYGTPGLGKTGTAWILCRIIQGLAEVNAAYLDAPTPRAGRQEERVVLRSILTTGVGRVPDQTFRNRTDQEICDMILAALFARDIRLMVIDEAGRLGFRGLEAIGVLVDRAVMMDADFHVVLVGMERLPETLRSNPRMRSRIAAWENFTPLAPDVFGAVLHETYPTIFDALGEAERRDAVVALHEASGGSLREVLSVLSEASVLEAEGVSQTGILGLIGLLNVQRASCDHITRPPQPQARGRDPGRHQTAFPRRRA